MALLETPSRIWRRIEAVEDRDMPSLPSLPAFEDSVESDQISSEIANAYEQSDDLNDISAPIHSTPAAASIHNTVASTMRAASSTSSTARFASSIASRSTKSSSMGSSAKGISARRSSSNSFDVSIIPSLPDRRGGISNRYSSEEEDMELEGSKESVPDIYLPEPEGEHDGQQELSLADELQSISRISSPASIISPENEPTPRKYYEYSVSLRSEPKPSPFDKYRNVALRKPLARIRTPSLSRTTPSPTSSPTNSTPHTSRSITLPRSVASSPLLGTAVPLPRSTTASPAIVVHAPEEQSQELASNEGHEPSLHEEDAPSIHEAVNATQLEPMSGSEADSEAYRPSDASRNEHEDESAPDEREPTFSSEGGPTPYAQARDSPVHNRTPTGLSSAFSSPAPSTAFTPTPAFPRPHARFSIPAPHLEDDDPGDSVDPLADPQDDDIVTPHTRRRSFLLSVINSTARPRLRLQTPHPRGYEPSITATPSATDSIPEASGGTRTDLRVAFAGVTPRPRTKGRTSHPLAKAIVASPGTSESDSASPASGSGLRGGSNVVPGWTTPVQALSPYEGDRASVISTASSHDLTTYHRANTSFDPAVGLGAQGYGLARFNAGKLNSYLHGLNRRLQEENEALVERLRRLEEDKKMAAADRRLGAAGIGAESRRVSAGGTVLGDVVEDVSGEGWVEEKAQLEETVAAFQAEVAKCIEEKEEAEKALEEERQGRARDKERWKERMGEVEKGVESIVKDLEKKLQDAEMRAEQTEQYREDQVKELEKRLTEVQDEYSVAMARAEKAEQVLEGGKELGGELREANERIGKVLGDLRNANSQIQELEDEVMRADGRIDELEKQLRKEKELSASLDNKLQVKSGELDEAEHKVSALEGDLQHFAQDLQATKTYVAELEEHAGGTAERIDSLEEQLTAAQDHIDRIEAAEGDVQDRAHRLEGEAERAAELARQMEEALEAAEKKMLADEERVAELKAKVQSLERELDRLHEQSQSLQDPSRSQLAPGSTDADVHALEDELDEANKEIARLNTLLSQSPARKAIEKAKDTKIEMLEREKEELMERVKVLRITATELATPSKIINASGISPIHRQVLSMSIRAPRTPGAPLKDMSWLNSSPADPTISPLIAEISRLHRELDRANESIDDKLDKLEDAGLGVVGLTKKLEDARSKIIRLEDEIARLSRRDDRRSRRLERVRCQKCQTKVNFHQLNQTLDADESAFELSNSNLPSEPPTPPTKTSEALRANLQSVNTQLASMKRQWEEERRQLVGEKAVLQDAASRLNAQVRDAQAQAKRVAETERAGEKARAGIQGELDKAKSAIADLESDLKAERSRLRALTTEQSQVEREKENVLLQLRRTESDMEDVKKQLQKFKQDNQELEREMRVTATAEQKARLLESRVMENTETIEQLRQERSMLASDYKDLQRRFTEISEHANRLRDAHAASQTSHDARRHALDLHQLEIDDLRRALAASADELQRAEAERVRAAAEKDGVARTAAALEADLRRVRRDAEAFGRELKALRTEKDRAEARQREEVDKAERARKQSQSQIRVLNEQLEEQRAKAAQAKTELKNHVCPVDMRQLQALKVQHNKESKGLLVLIHYLRAKCDRTATFRTALVYQKQYLLALLTGYKKSEQTIIALIAQIGFPIAPSPPERKSRSLKSIATCVVFLLRAKWSSDAWRELKAVKADVTAAHEEVRRRRKTIAS